MTEKYQFWVLAGAKARPTQRAVKPFTLLNLRSLRKSRAKQGVVFYVRSVVNLREGKKSSFGLYKGQMQGRRRFLRKERSKPT